MRIAALILALVLPLAASAKVIDVQATGFEVQQTVEIKAPPEKVWAGLVKIGAWWDSAHTFSQSSQNLTLAPYAGGCFCEIWPQGSVRHMTVVQALNNKLMRLEGALGPMQALGATGHLTWTLTPSPTGVTLSQTYMVGGYYPKGWQDMAPAVDRVLAEQANRLKAYVESQP